LRVGVAERHAACRVTIGDLKLVVVTEWRQVGRIGELRKRILSDNISSIHVIAISSLLDRRVKIV